ncbi:MAG TPA: TIGR03862 family flavoprotein [Burkholderiaceae bacterium]
MTPPTIAVIGAGPAGLMAAETLAAGGARVHVYDGSASAGRKFLLAGRGGMNITHSEPLPAFVERYANRTPEVAGWLDGFGPDALRAWVHDLGIATFVGSSGRVFPTEMKAAPLLRAWLLRLRESGVQFHMRHRWTGWSGDGALRFSTPDGDIDVRADAVVLALGGASWARLGSDGAWVPLLQARGVEVAPLRPANCGFDIGWSAHFAKRYAGEPLLSVALAYTGLDGIDRSRKGQFVVTSTGIEGSLVYAVSRDLRETIAAQGSAAIALDLLPDWSQQKVEQALASGRGARSMASHLQSRANLTGVKAGLLREVLGADGHADAMRIAQTVKRLALVLRAPRPIDEAISTAGGVTLESLTGPGLRTMLRAAPGVFCAGEMLDWEAPTGGYLLTACFASGRVAGQDALAWLAEKK